MLPNSVKFYPFPEFLSKESLSLENTAAWGSVKEIEEGMIYIHIPFCRFLCDYCPLYKEKSNLGHDIEKYLSLLMIELKSYAEIVRKKSFNTIYLGGGTASILSIKQLDNIISKLNEYFNISHEAEITLEGLPLDFLDPFKVNALSQIGINRVSMGVQSFDTELMKNLGRPISSNKIQKSIEIIGNSNMELNVDMMFGFINMNQKMINFDIEMVRKLPIDSLDYYSYMPILGTKAQKDYLKLELPISLENQRKSILNAFSDWTLVSAEAFSRSPKVSKRVWEKSFGGKTGLSTVVALGPSSYGVVNGYYYHNISDLVQYNELVSKGRFPLRSRALLQDKVLSRKLLLGRILQTKIYKNDMKKFKERELKLISYYIEKKMLIEDNKQNLILSNLGMLNFTNMQAKVIPLNEAIVMLENYMLNPSQQKKYLLQGKTNYLSEIRILGHLEGRWYSWFLKKLLQISWKLPKKISAILLKSLQRI